MRKMNQGHAGLKRLKARTEVGTTFGDKDTKMEDVDNFETLKPKQIGAPTLQTLL
jgi:hypothetical protein